MPSDDETVTVALRAIQTPMRTFRSALATTVEELRSILADHHAAVSLTSDDEQAELGAFAAGRIDADRFSAFIGPSETLDDEALVALEAAHGVLAELSRRGTDLSRCDVPSGADLRDTVAAALAEIGRAFGAARVAGLARSHRYVEAEHAWMLERFPRATWSPTERSIAPPLLVTVDGVDLQAEGLADFLDGTQKVVIAVRGLAPPAPLARLATPGIFVLQTDDTDHLARFFDHDGPGVAALMPEGAARFAHDPALGERIWERLVVEHLPEIESLRVIGERSPWQQAQDLRLLADLATPPPTPAVPATPTVIAAPAAAVTAATPAEPVDRLAAWLIGHADLDANPPG